MVDLNGVVKVPTVDFVCSGGGLAQKIIGCFLLSDFRLVLDLYMYVGKRVKCINKWDHLYLGRLEEHFG